MRASIRRGVFIALVAALVIGGLAWAFWPQPVPVDLAGIERGHLRVTVDGDGQTRVREVYTVHAPLAGRVARIDLRAGDAVVGGRTILTSLEETEPTFLDARTRAQLQAEIEAHEAELSLGRAELQRARAELAFARAELARAETLFARGSVTERARDQARLEVDTREAQIASIEAQQRMRRARLDRARAALIEPGEDGMLAGARCCIPVRAPVSGRVLRVMAESERVVAAGEPLIEIGDPADLEVVVDLPSSDAVRIEAGASVLIDGWGGTHALDGRVRRVEPYGFTRVSALGIEEQRVNVIIDLLDPPEARPQLGHGFRVVPRIVVHEADDVLLVPTGALFREAGQWAVFVDEDGTARLRTVTLGESDGRRAEVADGLDAGERVILHPTDRVADGVRITPRS